MKIFFKHIAFTILSLVVFLMTAEAQCSVCTKTAEQLGEKPGKGLNAGILYLMLVPLIFIGIVVFRFLKRERPVAGQ